MHWETKKLCDWLYCGICFIAVVWNQIYNICKVMGLPWWLGDSPARQEMCIQSLGQEAPLEKETATLCSTLAWKIPWTEEPGGLRSTGSQRVGHHWPTNTFTSRLLQKGRPAGEDRTKKAGGQGFFLFFSTLAKGWLENSLRDGNTRPPYLSPEKPVCGSRSNS